MAAMTGRHTDADGDGIADQGLSDPFADPQDAAFASPDPDVLVDDAGLAAMHESGELRDATTAPVLSPEEFEVVNWDADRVGPKSAQDTT